MFIIAQKYCIEAIVSDQIHGAHSFLYHLTTLTRQT